MVLEYNPQRPDKETPESGALSIQVPPSPSLILAVSQLFRSHHQPQQAIELCRQGLALFPGDLGLRLGMAMSLGDLQQKEEAWAEIDGVAQELRQWSPVLEKIAEYAKENEQPRFSGWFARLSQVLSQNPAESPAAPNPSGPAKAGEVKISSQEELSGTPEGESNSDPNVLSTLNDWLTQLKKD
jgi:hypothetical protein